MGPVLGVPLPTPDPLNVHIHLDDVMKKDMESAGKSEEPGEDYGDHGNYPVVPDEKPVHYGEAEEGNEMNIGSIGNVLGNVNDGTNGNSMHGSNMFSGGASLGEGNGIFEDKMKMEDGSGASKEGASMHASMFYGSGSSDRGNTNNLFSGGGGMLGTLNSLTGGFGSGGGGTHIVGGAQSASGTNVNQNNIG